MTFVGSHHIGCRNLTKSALITLKNMKSDMTVKYTPENKHGDIGGEGPGNRSFYYYPMVL